MNAWDIYWVLQLDSISGFLTFLSIVSGFAWFFSFTFGIMADPESCDASDARIIRKLRSVSKVCISVFIASSISATLLPSTKTAAAMYVVPAIVNNDHIQHEAGDLYKLAKQALKQAVTGSDKK